MEEPLSSQKPLTAESVSISSTLLQRVRAEHPDAWQRLTKIYGPEVYRWVRIAGLQASDAVDVVQEVFLAVASNIGGFRRDGPGDSFRGWLWAITRNKVRDHFRRRASEPEAIGGTDAQKLLAQIPDSSPAEPEDSLRDGVTQVAHRVLELVRVEFEDRTWQAFLQATCTPQSAAEIAEDLGMTKKAVRQAKYRVLQRIRGELDGML